MVMNRSHALSAAVAAAAALTATGITYAAAAPAPQAAPAVVQAPVQAPMGGGPSNNNNERGENEHGGKKHERKHHEEGWIHINERSYSAHSHGCVVVLSGLGSTTLNIRNESRKTVEVFRGVTCDNGAPIATVGPHSSSNGVNPGRVRDGVKVKDGVVGSFRVIDRHHHDDKDDDGDY
jgi:hypothetical protein